MRRGVFGGADVRPVRGVCGRSGRRQHGGWAGRNRSIRRSAARQAALSECGSRGGSGCTVRVWGCNGPVIEEGLGLNQAARRQIQQGLQATGFDPGGADGLFGPRTRAAIRSWQSARGARSTGYLDGPQVEALRGRGEPRPLASAGPAAADSGALELAFWQSIQNTTNPVEFEAYLEQFPNGVFRVLAQGPGWRRCPGLRSPATHVGRRVWRFAPVRRAPASRPAQHAGWRISQQSGCYVWNPGLALGATVTWTAGCAGSLAQGAGTLTWVWDGNRQTATGRLEDGKRNGARAARASALRAG